LGLKNLFISGVLLAFIFGLMVLSFHQKKAKWLMRLSGILALIFFGYASYTSGFSVDHKKPNSIVYIQNDVDKTAYFATYNTTLDKYTKQIFDASAIKGSIANAETKSKYNTRFTYHKKTTNRNVLSSDMLIDMDTIIGENRFLELVIKPNRKINKFEFITKNKITFKQFKVNDALVLKGKNYTIKNGTFLIYHMANSDKELILSFTVDATHELDFIVNEISYDLLTNPNFSMNPRSEEMMPMPFVTNDAIIISKKFKM